MKMLHTMGTVHLTELYGNQVNLIPEEHRKRVQVTPDVAKGLAQRMLVNVKHDVTDWVLTKMDLRRSVLPRYRNYSVLFMLKQTMWSPDLFPKSAFDELRRRNPGKTNLEALLGISPKFEEFGLGSTQINTTQQ